MRKFIIIIVLFYHNQVIGFEHNTLESRINNIISKTDPNVNIGIKIKNLQTNKVLYQRNPHRYYTFASSLKMITIFALQEYFGKDYLFLSKLLKKNEDYYLNIATPNFSIKDLELLIKQARFKEIKGNFYIVNNQFTLPSILDSKMVEDNNYCYGAPITKSHINQNCVRLFAEGSKNLKIPGNISIKESTPYSIVNNTSTIPDNDHQKIKISIIKDRLIIEGTLNRSSNQITIGAVVNNPLAHIQRILIETLKKFKINLSGKILLVDSPKDAKIVSVAAKTFSQLGSKALQISDNFTTDYLLAEFGSHYAIHDWKNCCDLLKKLIMHKFNVDFNNSIIADGSGLSRYNMFTVNQFDEFLSAVYNRPDFNELIQMLAKPTEEGTLKNRFKNVKIFAKTGSLNGVSSLVGYIYDKHNTPYSFVIVTNNFLGTKDKYAKMEEELLRVATGN